MLVALKKRLSPIIQPHSHPLWPGSAQVAGRRAR